MSLFLKARQKCRAFLLQVSASFERAAVFFDPVYESACAGDLGAITILSKDGSEGH